MNYERMEKTQQLEIVGMLVFFSASAGPIPRHPDPLSLAVQIFSRRSAAVGMRDPKDTWDTR